MSADRQWVWRWCACLVFACGAARAEADAAVGAATGTAAIDGAVRSVAAARVEQLRAQADAARREGRTDEAVALAFRWVVAARRLDPDQSGGELASFARDAYLELARDLLRVADPSGAAEALACARVLDAEAPEVEVLELELGAVARAAYLRGYALHRDGGPRAVLEARRLWAVAVAVAPPESETARKARALLEVTHADD